MPRERSENYGKVDMNIIDKLYYDFNKEESSIVALINEGALEEFPEIEEDELKEFKQFQLDQQNILSVRIIASEDGVLRGFVIAPAPLYLDLDSTEKKKIFPVDLNIASIYKENQGEYLIGSLIEVLDQWTRRHNIEVEYKKYLGESE